MSDTSQAKRVRLDREGDVWFQTPSGRWSDSGGNLERSLEELEAGAYGPTTEAYLVPADQWGRFDTLRRAKAGADLELQKTREKLAAAEKASEQWRSYLTFARERAHGLNKRADQLERELAALRQGLAGVLGASGRNTDEQLIAGLKGHFDALQRTVEGWRATAQQQTEQIHDLRRRLHDAHRAVDDKAATIAHLREEVERWRKRAEAAERDLADRKARGIRIFEATNAWGESAAAVERTPQKVSLDEETRDWIADMVAEVRRG